MSVCGSVRSVGVPSAARGPPTPTRSLRAPRVRPSPGCGPAHHRAVERHATGVLIARTDCREGLSGRLPRILRAPAPARHIAIGPDAAAMRHAGNDTGKCAGRGSGLPFRVVTPAHQQFICTHGTRVIGAGTDAQEGAVGCRSLAPVVFSPALDLANAEHGACVGIASTQ